ncbi:MAG: TolC family protein [Holosporaceae bacterium]|jgi:outer membrane protein|nr:TolC family protein [Holosporaceae bacterium]
MVKIKSVFLGAIAACCYVLAEENAQTDTLTIEEAVVAAYNNNMGWRASQTDKKSAEESLTQAKMMILPDIQGRVSTSRSGNRDSTHQSGLSEELHDKTTQTSLALTIRQNLFNGFATVNRVKACTNAAKSSDHKLKFDEQKLILQVINAYTSIWVGRQKVAALKKKEENLKKAMDSKNTSLEAGAGTPSELAQAKANYSKAVYERIEAETELFTAEADFTKLTNIEAKDKNIELPDLDIQLPENLDELIANAMALNHSVLSKKFEERAEFDNLNVARGALFPSCNLTISANRNFRRDTREKQLLRQKQLLPATDTTQNAVSASLEVDIPIFSNSPSSGNSYSSIAIANQRALKAKFSAEDALLEVKKECVDNWNKYISAGAMIKSSRSAVKSAELSTESNIEENVMGTKSNTEVLVEENQLLDARINLANSRKQKIMSAMTIYALSGNLSLHTLLKKK